MPITDFTSYVYSPSSQSAPSISINWKTSTAEAINAAVETYNTQAAEYAESFLNILTVREAVRNKFMLDACEGVGLVIIDKQTNSCQVNEKANEFYEEAIVGKDLSKIDGLTAANSNLKRLVLNLFTRDDFDSETITAEDLIFPTDDTTTTTEPYIENKYVLSLDVAEEGQDVALLSISGAGDLNLSTTNALFIQDNLSKVGNERTFTNYKHENGSNTRTYVIQYMEASKKWGLFVADDTAIADEPVALTDSLGTERAWIAPQQD